jgi:hypothetical protein
MTSLIQPQPTSDNLELPWSWCARCQRAYASGTCRVLYTARTARTRRALLVKLCPYEDCSGSATRDRWRWETIRFDHPEYPLRPERYHVYAR